MEGKDQPCKCGHNRWKTLKKKKAWKCRKCGTTRILKELTADLDAEVAMQKAQREDNRRLVGPTAFVR